MSSLKEPGDLFWMLTHEETQSGFFDIFFFYHVVVRSFTADSNLLQPTRGVNRIPSHVTFSRVSRTHFFNVAHMTLAQVWLSAQFISCVICMLCVA